MNIILLSSKPWHDKLFAELQKDYHNHWYHIKRKEDFTEEQLNHINPSWIFIPHWSDIIPAEIYTKWKCVVFHMTDLPYGRGGSPLQNLIIRGHTQTKISAIAVEKGIDTGPVYLKKDLSLDGTAEEIFIRSANVIGDMIYEILFINPKPVDQKGEVLVFKRRKPEDGNISSLTNIKNIYDHIRMLDAETYPKAFIETDHFKIEFTNAHLENNEVITANVRIIKK